MVVKDNKIKEAKVEEKEPPIEAKPAETAPVEKKEEIVSKAPEIEIKDAIVMQKSASAIKAPVKENEEPTEQATTQDTKSTEKVAVQEQSAQPPESTNPKEPSPQQPEVKPQTPAKSPQQSVKKEEKTIEKDVEVKHVTDQKKEPEEKSSLDTQNASPLDKKNRTLFKFGIIGLIIILIITGALFYFFLNIGSKKVTPSKVEKTIVTPTKAPEKKQLDKSLWTLEVLNGSGIKGAAVKAAEELSEQGYTVVKIDNADNQDYTENKLFVSEEMENEASLLIDDLQADYGFSSVSGVLTGSTASARIILGAI